MRIKNAAAVSAFRDYMAERDKTYISISTAKTILEIASSPKDAVAITSDVRYGKSLSIIAIERLLARVNTLEQVVASMHGPIKTEVTFEASDLDALDPRETD